MKKKLLRLCSIVLIISMVLGNVVSLAADTESTETTEPTGATFSENIRYVVDKAYTSEIKTFEATVCLPEGLDAYNGVIFGDYGLVEVPQLSFNIMSSGYPYVYYNTGSTSVRVVFKTVIPKEKVTHLAFVMEEVDDVTNVSCYVDGVKVEELASGYSQPTMKFELPTSAFCVGGDHRTGNTSYFPGEIYSVAAYSDIRSADEIATDAASSVSTEDADMIAYYDLTNVTDAVVNNSSTNDSENTYRLNVIKTWMDTVCLTVKNIYTQSIVRAVKHIHNAICLRGNGLRFH